MSRKRKTYTAEFKAKCVLELLEGEKTLSEVASKYDILPKSLQQWKRQFLQNASLAFDKRAVVKEYKDEIEQLSKEKDKIAKKLGEVIVERDWLVGKLRSLDLSTKRRLVDRRGGVRADSKNPSLKRQLRLLRLSKTALYYKPATPFGSIEDKALLDAIDKIHTAYPYYGIRRTVALLKRLGFSVGRKRITKAFAFMGIRALYPKRRTTQADTTHRRYSYLLHRYRNKKAQVCVAHPNEVWSGDITYIRLEKGYAYLCAIIDWHSKKILAYTLSSTMDTTLTVRTLQKALSRYGKPKIFNSDQGSQYTAKEHIETLERHGVSISMDAKGRSIDNIAIERFWRTLKYEDVYPSSYQTLKEAKEGIEAYICTYNKERLHSTLGYKTPDEVYYQGAHNKSYDATKALLKVA